LPDIVTGRGSRFFARIFEEKTSSYNLNGGGSHPPPRIIGMHFRQPKEGTGKNNSVVAHMWRTIAMPDNPL